MKQGKLIIGILSVCVFSLISFIAIEKKGEVNANPAVSENDVLKVDSLQLLVNRYCKLNLSIDSINKIVEFKKSVDNDILSRIKKLNTDIVNYDSSKKSIINKTLNDTLRKSKIAHYDSLIDFTNKKISILKKLINQKETDRLENERNLRYASLDLITTNLRTFSEEISGSKAIVFNGVKYKLFVANLDSTKVRLHLLRPKHMSSLGNVKEYLEAKKIEPLMITNAGMFTTSFEPEGLYIEDNPLKKYDLDIGDQKSILNFYLRPNGVFYIDNKNIPHIDTTQEFARLQKSRKFKVKLATQSGPMLVINGRIHPAFVKGSKNYKIRSGVGIVNKKKVVFACTLDGSNFYDFAVFMRDVFNCKNALFLDGAISKMYLHDIDSTETGGQFGPILSVSRKNKK